MGAGWAMVALKGRRGRTVVVVAAGVWVGATGGYIGGLRWGRKCATPVMRCDLLCIVVLGIK